ncbi:MAG: DUF1361 domain-containing protein [Pegethrix bostrychoides GSE-TBD4-15B]|jgi:uncharacterized membrane protein|uniref:DUF1361 domain-containing protein n=1 Tax=Pegethrix bostrychoides GSE-TBD4-15B TaxID=2839662 RepID=A0A951U2T6_9CYAN|nr:DUF1361 domain-containing protein [Pegethrix bostrychoides GSE-TBD4-15B]
MSELLSEIFTATSNVYSGWILWNLFLAFIPLVLSFWLFRRKKISRKPTWWLALAVFIAFLPNAPYLLTDIVHLIRGTRAGLSIWAVVLVLIPLHLSAIVGGFAAYVISLINLGYYLRKQGAQRLIVWATELLVHLLCAVGVFMGRFRRFNSWDLVTGPGDVLATTLDDLTSKRPVAVIVLTFIVLTVFYWVMKQITLGLYLRYRFLRMGKEVLE